MRSSGPSCWFEQRKDQSENEPESNLHVLYLEDDPLDAEMVRDWITHLLPGSSIWTVRTAEEFLHALATQEFHFILSDYVVPGYSGAEAFEAGREHAPDCPFVFVTGIERHTATLPPGADGYVSKQRLHEISGLISSLVRSRGSRGQ